MLNELTARAAAKAEHKILLNFILIFPFNKNFIINSRKRENKKSQFTNCKLAQKTSYQAKYLITPYSVLSQMPESINKFINQTASDPT